ncbi:hypothetical protein GOP47_0020712 [Adiantum capillus-veneris]|uniref:Uncharacterized protein n=1 Tax=Adiantum capillus-veneris TaxID=13818 RepID=A0A9D4Z7Z9_ADICA|nr:hypothetical protein GOP47_0020712 [Adiantum capillus-veneris]
MSAQVSNEFWRLFAIYINKLCKEPSSSSTQEQLEDQVLPLLDRLDFLSHCRDLQALETILTSLYAAGYQLPLSSLKALSADLLFKGLSKPRFDGVASDVKCSKVAFGLAKRSLHYNFHDFREALAAALTKLTPDSKLSDNALQMRLCALEEEICWSICDENQLLQYVTEADEHVSNNVRNPEDGQESILAEEGSRLAGFIRCGLQSQDANARLQTLKLAVACSFHSYFVFTKFFPLFQTALYLEDFDFRQYVFAALMDLIYMHHKNLSFSAISHLVLPFLYAPTVGLQLVAVIGCGRLLLYDCFPEEMECLLGAMMERYVYDQHINVPPNARSKDDHNGNLKLKAVVKALHCFFQEYSGGKKLHQDEIANALVYMCLEKVEEGVILLVHGSNQQGLCMKDNPERSEEARRLHLVLHFGLSISENTLDALLDSLVLNINEQRGAAPVPHPMASLLSRNSCRDWLLQSSL